MNTLMNSEFALQLVYSVIGGSVAYLLLKVLSV